MNPSESSVGSSVVSGSSVVVSGSIVVGFGGLLVPTDVDVAVVVVPVSAMDVDGSGAVVDVVVPLDSLSGTSTCGPHAASPSNIQPMRIRCIGFTVAESRYDHCIVFASPSRVLWVPLLPAVLGMFALGVGVAIGREMLWFALGGVIACAFAVVMSRRVRREGDRVTVRGVIAKDEIGSDAAFGYRGVDARAGVEIYATDGERIVVLWSMTAMGMNAVPRTLAKLRGAIPTTPTEAATALVKEIEAPFEDAMRQVRAYYDRK